MSVFLWLQKRCFTLLLAVVSTGVFPHAAGRAAEIRPNLEPGRVYTLSELPRSWYSGFFESRSFRGQTIMAQRASLKPGQGIPLLMPTPGDRFVFVLKGPAVQLLRDSHMVLHDRECIYLGEGTESTFITDGDSAELLDILIPGIPFLADSKLRRQEPAPIKASTVPSLEPGAPFSLNSIPFVEAAKGVYLRLMQGSRGQVAFLTMLPGSGFSERENRGEGMLILMDGAAECSMGRNTLNMEPGNVIYLESGMQCRIQAGREGCELLSVRAPSSSFYSAFLNDPKLDAFHRIIPRGARPEIVFDGLITEHRCLSTEGASWLDGRVFFSSQMGTGIYSLSSDGACETLCREKRFCGTTPLPNGNLAACNTMDKTVNEITPRGEIVRAFVDPGEDLITGNPNDLVADFRGGLYVSVNNFYGEQSQNYILYIPPGGKARQVVKPGQLRIPNGMVLSPDHRRLYINDDSETLWMADIRENGDLDNIRPFARLLLPREQYGRETLKSASDGMKIDDRGNLYVCSWLGVQIIDAGGTVIGLIPFPGNTYSCTFGGEDLSILYIASGRFVYSLRTGVRGVQFPARQ